MVSWLVVVGGMGWFLLVSCIDRWLADWLVVVGWIVEWLVDMLVVVV